MSVESNKNNQASPGKQVSIKPETFEKLIELQTKEQANRAQELQLRAKELEHNAKHANEMLAAQERDREKTRQHDRRMTRGKLIFAGLVLLVVLIFTGIALRMNKDAFVMEALKLIVTFLAGGAGGYGAAKARQDNKPDDDK